MAKTIQVRVDDKLKHSADMLFSSLGLDTSTAIRMFLVASLETNGIPFVVRRGDFSNMRAWELLQSSFAGEAERVGWQNEQDVVDFCKEIRREMQGERNGHND